MENKQNIIKELNQYNKLILQEIDDFEEEFEKQNNFNK